uniref:Uncharacterized protein n=1 Tax=Brassica campestris TaxID=3711 RepID=A0A3P6BKQ8_BRACM|nr:unnamed protein product [Brassica rapa]
MTRSSRALLRELESTPFPVLRKLTSLKMMLSYSSLTLKFKPLLLLTHGL